MTTVAYRDNIMAGDSCLSTGDENTIYVGDVDKVFRLKDGSLFAASGDSECQQIMRVLESGAKDHKIPGLLAKIKSESECMLVRPDGRMYWIVVDDGYGEFTEFKDQFCAIGSGKDFAYGAMEAGASALEAVRCASRRHAFTRGPFMFMDLKSTGCSRTNDPFAIRR